MTEQRRAHIRKYFAFGNGRRHLKRLGPATAFLLLLSACTGLKSGGTPPQEMSAAEHRRHADQHSEEAKRHRDKFDPDASRTSPIAFQFPVVSRPDADPADLSQQRPAKHTKGNPTEKHLHHAHEHQRHAAEHRASALHLERSTDLACQGLHDDTRELCPFSEPDVLVVTTDEKVIITLTPDADSGEFLARLECHYAQATETHFEGMATCPLYIQKLDVKKSPDRSSIVISSEDPQSTRELLKRAQEFEEGAGGEPR